MVIILLERIFIFINIIFNFFLRFQSYLFLFQGSSAGFQGLRIQGLWFFQGSQIRVWRWRETDRAQEDEESFVRLCGSACTRLRHVKPSQGSEDQSFFAANARSYRCLLFSRNREKEGKRKGEKKTRDWRMMLYTGKIHLHFCY